MLILALIGGGTSLFLGCSCVTLMETFVFLFKLIVQGLTKEIDTADVDETMTGIVFNRVECRIGVLVKPIKLEKVRTIDDPEQGGMAPGIPLSSLIIFVFHILQSYEKEAHAIGEDPL